MSEFSLLQEYAQQKDAAVAQIKQSREQAMPVANKQSARDKLLGLAGQLFPKSRKSHQDLQEQGGELKKAITQPHKQVIDANPKKLNDPKAAEREQKEMMRIRKFLDYVRHRTALERQATQQLTQRYQESKPTSSGDWGAEERKKREAQGQVPVLTPKRRAQPGA